VAVGKSGSERGTDGGGWLGLASGWLGGGVEDVCFGPNGEEDGRETGPAVTDAARILSKVADTFWYPESWRLWKRHMSM